MPAANPFYAVLPRHTQFQIGRDLLASQANNPLVGIIKREGVLERAAGDPATTEQAPARIPLFCCVANHGTADFTLEVRQSSNNNSDGEDPDTGGTGPLTPDAYAAAQVRVDGADVASGDITVVPGGRVVFFIEWDEGYDDYLKFDVAEEVAFGELTVSRFNGSITIRQREGVI
jgi:hypothetical protein